MLTLQELKDMEPRMVFAKGKSLDNEHGLFMAGTGRELRWVACRGYIYDWAIYCHTSDKTMEWIKKHGDKVHDERNIKMLVPCDDESFKMYRH